MSCADLTRETLACAACADAGIGFGFAWLPPIIFEMTFSYMPLPVPQSRQKMNAPATAWMATVFIDWMVCVLQLLSHGQIIRTTSDQRITQQVDAPGPDSSA